MKFVQKIRWIMANKKVSGNFDFPNFLSRGDCLRNTPQMFFATQTLDVDI